MSDAQAIRRSILACVESVVGPLQRARRGSQTYSDGFGLRHVVRTRADFHKPDFDQYWWNLEPVARDEGDHFYFGAGSYGYLHFTRAELEDIADGFHAEGTRPSAIVRPSGECEIYVSGRLRDVTDHVRYYH